MDTTQEPLANDNDSHLYYQFNLWDLPCHNRGPADRFGPDGHPPSHYSRDAGGPVVVPGAQSFLTSPIPRPTHAENNPFPPEEYTRATSGSLLVVPDPPAWPTLRRPIDMARESCNDFRPPCIPEVEYGPMGYRWSHIDRLGPFLVKSCPQAVGSGIHPGPGGLLNGPGSELPRGVSEVNTIGPYEDTWVPFARPPPPAGQATFYQPSGGISAQVEIHPPGHVLERGKYETHRISERGEKVALSDGEMNRAEQSTMSNISNWPDQCFEATPSLDRNEYTSTICTPIETGVSTCRDRTVVYHTPASLPSSSAHTSTFPGPASPRAVGAIRTVQPNHRASHRYEGSVFDRPGKKAAADYEPDPDTLRKCCLQRGGREFAIAWLSEIFVDGVTVGALMRPLAMLEIDAMILRRPGFKPAQGYDGFLDRHNERFGCGLCPDEKRMHWKNKKDAVPHLRKFHLGLADRCVDW